MATFEDIKNQVLLVLGENPDEEPGYHEDLLLDAVCGSLDAILPRVWKPSTDTITGGAIQHQLPSDIFEIQAIWDDTLSMFLDPAVLAAGEPSASVSGNGWYQFPHGHVSFYSELGDNGGTLMYAATWVKPAAESDTIESPAYSHLAMTYYAASYTLLSKATSAAELGAYRTRIDSGTPEHNPVRDISTYFLQRFEMEMERMPTITKGSR
jgi:hypothetical protein